jgi:porin
MLSYLRWGVSTPLSSKDIIANKLIMGPGSVIRKILLGLFTVFALSTAWAQEGIEECPEANPDACDPETVLEWVKWITMAGTDQVERRLSLDALPGDPLISGEHFKNYFVWKDRIKKEHGLSFGTDYISAYMKASDSPGEDTAFSGAYRFYGAWEATGDDQGNSGALIWKIEHRHAFGSYIPPADLGFAIGYAGLLHSTLSDQGGRLSNLYWRQRMRSGGLVLVGGWLDAGDYLDVYMLASPWTSFYNLAFSTGSASMPIPNEGLGLALGGYFSDSVYMIAGFADSNSNPHKPADAFDTFFDDREYFSHFEIGWNETRKTALLNNVHLTLWHADERVAAGTPDGWGASFSWSKSINGHWIPFIRAGYADDGGAILQKSISTGFAYQPVVGGNQFGVGFNWGEPSESTWAPGLKDQSSVELFYRIQLFEELAITPDLQYIKNPALNPAEDSLWVFGLRVRLAF